ncbi:MAG: dTDP-4-dehydrorhamnose reductase, partial [Pseudomonadota bacterium]
TGQVAQALAKVLRRDGGVDATFVGRPDFDLLTADTVPQLLDAHSPDLVLNAAAYTAVDQAERDSSLAHRVNAVGPGVVAKWCAKADRPFLHMSTDCVFDGKKDRGYVETDTPAPLSVYGRTKAAGERAVATSAPKYLIVRVGWVHSPFGKSFPRTMLSLAMNHNEVSVVDDQIGRPTHASDLAAGLVKMAKDCMQTGFEDWGIYHLAGQGETDRASMAEAVYADSAQLGGPTTQVRRVSSDVFAAAAARPLNARLDSERAKKVFGLTLPHWRDRLSDCVADILDEKRTP